MRASLRSDHARPWTISAAVALLTVRIGLFAVQEGVGIARSRQRVADVVRPVVTRHMTVSNDQALLNTVTAVLIVVLAGVVLALLRMTARLARGSRPAWTTALVVTAAVLAVGAALAVGDVADQVTRLAQPDVVGWFRLLSFALEGAVLLALLLPASRHWIRPAAGPVAPRRQRAAA